MLKSENTCFLISGCLKAVSIISWPGMIFHVGITPLSFDNIEITKGLGFISSAICDKKKNVKSDHVFVIVIAN